MLSLIFARCHRAILGDGIGQELTNNERKIMIPSKLTPLSEYFKRDSAYWGERSSWLVCYTITRDADCLARSNWRCFIRLLGGNGSEGAKGTQDVSKHVAIEEASHWAVGWVQYLIIDPAATELVALAQKALDKLDSYPVLNEDDFSEEESNEANEVWKNCYRQRDRVEYIRKHRNQFEFSSLADMLGCIRGKYFAGWAGELLS